MKLFLTISLVFAVSFAFSQVTFNMRMNVREMNLSGTIECIDDMPVMWGKHRDTIAFLFNRKSIYFYPVTNATWKKETKQRKEKLTSLVEHFSVQGDRLYILQDDLGEKYTVREVISKDGYILITIVNVDYGLPNYIFGFNCSPCIARNK